MRSVLIGLFAIVCLTACNKEKNKAEAPCAIHGWNILTDNDSIAVNVIKKASKYNINHLQLSHSIVMDLKDVKKKNIADKVNSLAELAHENSIKEVTIWDHALYGLNYYPDEFKTGTGGLIDLDNPDFWSWIKEDYRKMLMLVPNINGIILTFIETGAHVEDQYSVTLKTEQEKLAAMVDTLASVIIDEFDMNLYIRTFVYTRSELGSMLEAIKLIKNPKIKVMTKEVPHDFFITHPTSSFVKDIDKPVLIEYDCAHEYNGQGILTSIFPQVHLNRFKYYSTLPNVVGYVARTDRRGNTTIIDTPAEINLYALYKASNSKNEIEPEDIYNEYISLNYGSESVEYLKPAFKIASEVILSSLYTLGLPLNSHSRLDIEDDCAYQRHVAGKWLTNMYIDINMGNDTVLHYWKDIVNHLSPAWYKGANSQLSVESPWVLDSNWLCIGDMMNERYLDMIIREKEYSVDKAREALTLVREASEYVKDRHLYENTLHMFERTYLTAKLYKEVASAYFAYRVYCKDKTNDNDRVLGIINNSVENLHKIILEILEYPYSGAEGQFVWRDDAYRAMRYYLEFKSFKGNYMTSYTSKTFKRFDYYGVTEEEKKDLYNNFMKEICIIIN